ncbi:MULTISPECIES: uracil-DNA glycosylase [Myxococcus]|uniref:Uracil-DNA glycosylase n=1 Tax=Myxococcus llanfairpwllgwyngyllgogerychwyrndrobwllllantysiliogogogochensis TaxID=2590453 RepID=A0A540WM39_9BACT|nr:MULTISPECIES: uracil-DNA glycosylase [Myxococcus]NTX06467.1 uracil-DNA glycosylase [Myxococcus sp. CA040A]TQF10092.1 uracil-DNA glycosylase [Myxococcus llanfairpwllgwyngyllgogerychwyrndrobwllllantysiliogogogochensis]
MLQDKLPKDWKQALKAALDSPSFQELERFVAKERQEATVFPSEEDLFSAFRLTPYADVRVLLLGQDPYHGPGQAHGLAFSVKPGVPSPPSLVNIFKELEADVKVPRPKDGSLIAWAEQGVLLLNAVLTVRQAEPNSHAGHGWEAFTDAVIRAVSEKTEPVVFLLWGKYAQKKKKLIDATRHVVIEGTHPSPLSASSGFFGSRPFSAVNQALESKGRPPIDWRLTR